MKNTALINKLTLLEKAALLNGKTVWKSRDVPRLGIPSIFFADGPSGVRKQAGASDHLGLNPSIPATCFPSGATLANSWNEDLVQQIGQAIGSEASGQDVDVLLGPGLNIKRSPLCGRNFEYFSEDPYLSGKMAAAYIRGVESQGVATTPKHFAVNSQELRRMANDSILDDRTLNEIYLTGFEIAVKEGNPSAIMTSYNLVNGVYANENKRLLKDILREQWGFDGFVVTDWGGSNDHVAGVKNGSTLEMPSSGSDSVRQLLKAVESGELMEQAIDERVDELLTAVQRASKREKKISINWEQHHKIAQKAAEESIVLLKNDNVILPINKGARIAVIGNMATSPRYQGAGSSLVNTIHLEIPLEQLKKDARIDMIGYEQGYAPDKSKNATLEKNAVVLAKKADIVLLYIGLTEIDETEGLDRTNMLLPSNQIDLLEAISKVNSNIVAILSGGAPVEMPWRNRCTAIVHSYLGGQAGASAVCRVLMGDVNPSGKLNESYPNSLEDTPESRYYPGKQRTSEYREGIFVGYRYYITSNTSVCYPFGYGLSYTNFSYSDLSLNETSAEFNISNTGAYAGAEIAQMYIGFKDSKHFRPKYELKGFAKVFLEPGEAKQVKIPFDDKAFRYYNTQTQDWEIEEGSYQIYIAKNSEHINLEAEIFIKGTNAKIEHNASSLPSYYSGKITQVSDTEFAILLGKNIPNSQWSGALDINDSLCQMQYAKSRLARFVARRMEGMIRSSEKKGKPNLNALFTYNMPFRAIAKMTNGAVSMSMVDGIVTIVNGKFFSGIKAVVGEFFRNRKANKEMEAQLQSINDSNF